MSLWHAVIHPITGHFRKKRGEFISRNFPDIRTYKICDVGGSQHFWDKIGLDVPYENITIYNVSDGETQGIIKSNTAIELVIYDGVRIPVPDNYYDLVVCNSVIEHVPVEQREDLVLEMKRVGKRLFLQTPAYEFPVEPHFNYADRALAAQGAGMLADPRQPLEIAVQKMAIVMGDSSLLGVN